MNSGQSMTPLRLASGRDREDIRRLHLRAFTGDEGRMVSTLAVDLLNLETDPDTFSLVAETDGTLTGHVAFSPVAIDKGRSGQGYILAPLAVLPENQRRGIGNALVENGLQRLTKSGVKMVFVYGDPAYYGRFGFKADLASGYLPPYPLAYPFGWQALKLNEDGSETAVVRISCVAPLCDPGLW